jgi:hypothetical protein
VSAVVIVTARKPYTCDLCERRIETAERHATWTLWPSESEFDAPTRGRAHELCNAFFQDRVWPEVGHDYVAWDWEEDKREYGWDEWLSARVTQPSVDPVASE